MPRSTRSSEAGAKIVDVEVPAFTYGLTAYYLVAPSEASSNLARYDGVRYGLRVDAADTNAMYMATRAAGFGDEVKRRIMLGTYALSAGYYDAYYGKALKVRRRIAEDFGRAYEHADVLITPASPSVAFRLGDKTDNPLAMYLCDTYTIPSNLSGDPGVSVPFGTGADGLPVGVQVLAPALGEQVMFRVAAELERRARTPDDFHRGNGAGLPRSPCRKSGWAGTVSGFETIIGLEVHVELATATKLFSASPNRFGDEPNTNIDPVTLGLPGALPVLNRTAVELAMRIGLALNCTVQPCIFHRKNYFYPDMPKAYQISQYDVPLNVDGWLDLPDGTRVGIERAHVEEDTGKSTHVGGAGGTDPRQRRLADRLQPRRRPARRDRQPSGPALGGSGPRSTSPSCGRSSSRSAPATPRWRRARCASTPTSACVAPESRWAPAARSRTSTPCARSAGRSSTRSAARST